MPIKDYPFTHIGAGCVRPMLWVKVTNPDNGLGFKTLAIVDTGADDCAFPASIAVQLGHKLKSVTPKEIATAGGKTYAYPHTSRVEILEMLPNGLCGDRVLYSISEAPIDFVVGCEAFLLGRKKFLNNFVLVVDYPRQVFSIRQPRAMTLAKRTK